MTDSLSLGLDMTTLLQFLYFLVGLYSYLWLEGIIFLNAFVSIFLPIFILQEIWMGTAVPVFLNQVWLCKASDLNLLFAGEEPEMYLLIYCGYDIKL